MMFEKLSREQILEWDYNSWFEAVKYWDKLSINFDNAKCLELGARKGGLSLWLLSKGAKVVCSDLNNPQSIFVCPNEVANSNISFESIDILNIPYENTFDIVIFKSVIGGVYNGDNQKLNLIFSQIYKALKPGGYLLFAENSKSTPFHSFLRKNISNWRKSWNYISYDELKNELKAFNQFEIKSFGFFSLLIHNKYINFLLFLIDKLINPFIPLKIKYIYYGYAKK